MAAGRTGTGGRGLWMAAPGTDDSAAASREARVGALFALGLRSATVLLWVFAFLVFIAGYTLQSWVPTLLTEYGFSASQAPIGLAFLSFGEVVGGIALLLLALAGAGAGVTAGQIGQLTLAVAMYPPATRTAGVGWAAALGGSARSWVRPRRVSCSRSRSPATTSCC